MVQNSKIVPLMAATFRVVYRLKRIRIGGSETLIIIKTYMSRNVQKKGAHLTKILKPPLLASNRRFKNDLSVWHVLRFCLVWLVELPEMSSFYYCQIIA